MTGLPATGRLDNATTTKMESPRCGVPDVEPGGGQSYHTETSINGSLDPESFKLIGEPFCQHEDKSVNSRPYSMASGSIEGAMCVNSAPTLTAKIRKEGGRQCLCMILAFRPPPPRPALNF